MSDRTATLTEPLRAERDAAAAELDKIYTTVETRSTLEFTDAEQDAAVELRTRIDSLDGRIADAERDAERLNKPAPAAPGAPVSVRTVPRGGTIVERAREEGGIGALLGTPPGGTVPGAAGELLMECRSAHHSSHDPTGGVVVPHAFLASLESGSVHNRADAATTTTTLTAAEPVAAMPIMGQIFNMLPLMSMGIMTGQSVPFGDAMIRYINAGAAIGTPAEGAALDATAITLSKTQLSPGRAVSRATVTDVAMASFGPDLDRAIRENMRGKITEKIEAEGWAKVVAAAGAITNPSATVTWADVANLTAGAVDGRYASAMTDVDVFLGVASHKKIASLWNTNNDTSALDVLSRRSRSVSTVAQIPAPASAGTDANIQLYVLFRGLSGSPLTLAYWDAITVRVDQTSQAASGITAVTMTQMYAIHVETTTRKNFTFGEFKLA